MAKLVKFIKRTGVMTVETGLQINGPGVEIGPGGLDSEVIKNPLTKLPYVPGSSFKGKMRAELEAVLDKVNYTTKNGNNVGKPCGCEKKDCVICTLFGAHKNTASNAGTYKNTASNAGIPRLKFRDMTLCDEFVGKAGVTEDKAATMIDRCSGTASSGSLRHVERVSAGVKFNYEIVMAIYEGDNEKLLIETLDRGMKLIENTGLGGGTSHGNGKVSFTIKDEEIKA